MVFYLKYQPPECCDTQEILLDILTSWLNNIIYSKSILTKDTWQPIDYKQ